MPEPIINIKSLSKIYPLYDSPKERFKESLNPFRKKYHRDFYALKEVSFKVYKGETVGVVGKNGSGKSTLLKILTGVLTPSSGTFEILGKVSSLLELGTGFNPELSGIENVYFNMSIHGFSKTEIDKKLDEIIEFADIGEFIFQPVKTYSSGMYVRLAFSVAINIKPDILIIDEALSVGDIRFQQKCFRKIDEIRSSGVTIFFCSHDTGAIQNLCSNCIWLHDGKVRKSGEPSDVVKEYIAFMTYDNNIAITSTKSEELYELEKIKKTDKSVKEIPWKSTNGLACFGEGRARIINASFFHSNTNEFVFTLRGGEDIILGLMIEVLENISNPIVGFTVKNMHGVTVFATNTLQEESDVSKFKESGKVNEIYFSFKLPNLGNGRYLVDLAIADGTQLTHSQEHWVYDVFEFEVFNTADKSMFGYIVLNDVEVLDKIL